MIKQLSHSTHVILALTIAGAFLHFYNLNWGAPFYFHPDERNIASAVTMLSFPEQLNPQFFAYGSLPIYTFFFSGLLLNTFDALFQKHSVLPNITFDQAIIISRFYSALFATMLIPLMYLLGKRLFTNATGIIAAALTTFSTGFIQFAHFGTFEIWITLLSLCLFWHSLTLAQTGKKRELFLTALIFGALIATKVSAAVLIIVPLLAYLLFLRKNNQKISGNHKKPLRILRGVGAFFTAGLLFIVVSAAVIVVTNPFVLLDQLSFLNSMRYESSVGIGELLVFYTGGFLDTTPLVYQFLHVYPFLLNPIITIVLLPSFVYLVWITYKTKKLSYLLLLVIFLVLFLSQAVLFIKWTRNMIPTLPYLYLIIALVFTSLLQSTKHPHFSLTKTQLTLGSLLLIPCLIFSLSYFITAFLQQDTRFAAVAEAKKTIPANAKILSEPYDLGITPFNPSYPQIRFFNFYELDNQAPDATPAQLSALLEQSDYIILPSQRLLQTRMQNPERFPLGSEFYANLLSGNLGYELIYQTPCDIFCKITYLHDPVYYFEQTATVFDRPTVFIFQKQTMQALR